jgi:tetratricopeptide (TPR) repeat protein
VVGSIRDPWLGLLPLLLLGAACGAQELPASVSQPVSPRSAGNSEKENRRQARTLYGAGLLNARNNHLLEATRQLEEAWKLDPTAAPVGRALIPLYLTLGRADDALDFSRRVLDLDPDDFETWHSYARQLKDRTKTKEALEAMSHAASCRSLKERPHEQAQITFDLGVLYEEFSDLPKALAAFQQAETSLLKHHQTLVDSDQATDKQLQAELARLYEKKAQVCVNLQKFDQAATAYEKAQTILRDDLHDSVHADRLKLELAKAHQSAGRLEKSLAGLDEYLRTQPAEVEPYRLRIALLTDLGREAEIVPSLKSYADQDRRNIGLRLVLAEQYSKNSSDWGKAQEEYEALIREDPTPEVYRGLFGLLKKKGEAEHVLDKLDRALAAANPRDTSQANPSEAGKARAMLQVIRQDPDLVRQLIPLGVTRTRRGQGLDFWTRQFLAILAVRTNQLSAAENFYRSCLEESHPIPGFLRQEHEIYSGLLEVLSLQGKHEEIIEICQQGLKQAQMTNRLLFHDWLARTLGRLGKTEEALAEADQAIQVADENNVLGCRLLHATILAWANQSDRAVKECQNLFKDAFKPEDIHRIRSALSGIYSTAHENDKAEEQLRRIIADFPDDATAHNDLGYMIADQGNDLPEAENLIRRAIELDRQQKHKEANVGPDDDQDHAAFVDSLGWVLFRRGQLTEALHELQRASTLPEGDDPVIWDHLGDVHFRLGDQAKARESWSKAISLYDKKKRRKRDDQYQELKRKLKLLNKE